MRLWCGLFIAIVVAACEQLPAPTPQNADDTQPPAAFTAADSGDRLNCALLGTPPSLVPFLAGDTSAATLAGNVYQSLITYDGNLNLVPELAEKWHISPNGLTLTFTLKKGLTFTDGTPLTSRDVSATFHAIINPTTRTPYAEDYKRVAQFSTPDTYTVKVRYAEAFAPALSSWAGLPILPAHIIAKTPDFNQTSLKETPLGSGPYRLATTRRGQDYLFTANAQSSDTPRISELYYRIIPDQNAQWLALKAGELDMAEIPPLAYSRLLDAPWFKQNYNAYRYLSSSYTYLGFNLQNPMFADKRVRQALSHAINREGLINAVLFGQGEPIASIFKPGTWASHPTLQPVAFDKTRANALLDAAGWKREGTGLRTKNGQPFVFTVVTNQGNETRLKTAQVMQAMLAEVGIKMEIRVQEWSSFLTTVLKPRAFDAILMGWSLPAEPDPFDIWHSSKQGPDDFNIIGFNNAEADKAIEASRRTFNQAERQKHLFALQDILAEEQPYLWLYAPYALVAVHKRVQGITPAPAGIGYNSTEWWVPKLWHLRPALSQ
jgi:peptide/nickel transport system substrate-binding protein